MVKKPQSNKKKEAREKAIVALRVIVIATLVAGIHVFGLPVVTKEEALGAFCAVVLFGVVLKWVK